MDARRNREAVLDAAAKLLAAQPDASMADVADASGVGRTTVYRHFRTRDELLVGLFQRAVSLSTEFSAKVVQGDPPLAEVFLKVGQNAMTLAHQFRFLQSHAGVGGRAVDAATNHPQRPFTDYLKRAKDRGDVRDDVATTWIVSVTFATAVAVVDHVDAGLVDPTDAPGVVRDTLLRAFAG